MLGRCLIILMVMLMVSLKKMGATDCMIDDYVMEIFLIAFRCEDCDFSSGRRILWLF